MYRVGGLCVQMRWPAVSKGRIGEGFQFKNGGIPNRLIHYNPCCKGAKKRTHNFRKPQFREIPDGCQSAADGRLPAQAYVLSIFGSQSLGIQPYEYCLLWPIRSLDVTYLGLI